MPLGVCVLVNFPNRFLSPALNMLFVSPLDKVSSGYGAVSPLEEYTGHYAVFAFCVGDG